MKKHSMLNSWPGYWPPPTPPLTWRNRHLVGTGDRLPVCQQSVISIHWFGVVCDVIVQLLVVQSVEVFQRDQSHHCWGRSRPLTCRVFLIPVTHTQKHTCSPVLRSDHCSCTHTLPVFQNSSIFFSSSINLRRPGPVKHLKRDKSKTFISFLCCRITRDTKTTFSSHKLRNQVNSEINSFQGSTTS